MGTLQIPVRLPPSVRSVREGGTLLQRSFRMRLPSRSPSLGLVGAGEVVAGVRVVRATRRLLMTRTLPHHLSKGDVL